MTVPKMICASGSADSATICAASLTSNRVRSEPPVMLSRMPLAPAMVVSSNGLATASRAASAARVSPLPKPMPISEAPWPDMIALTSAKSRLISPGKTIRSEMP